MQVRINISWPHFDKNNDGEEVARILKELAERIRREGIAPGEGINLRDVNGNKVGEFYCD